MAKSEGDLTACADRPGYLPRFQPQLVASDPYGGVNCLAYAGAMAGDFDTCGAVHLTGEQVRQLTNEPRPDPKSPGLTLSQIDAALNRYGVDLEVRYRLPWDDFVRKVNKGEGAVLQVGYGPIADSRFDAGGGFRGNHGMLVPPGWGVLDPLADGRRSGIYKYSGEPYPQALLRHAAGRLVLNTVEGIPQHLGDGLVYAAFTRDRRSTWTWRHGPGRFVLWTVDEATRTCRGVKTQITGGTEPHACTPPRLYKAPDGSPRSLVRMLAGAYKDDYVSSHFATEVP